jgi:phosphatidylserine/phosphatidylglycerophosphate/cardiolipin synthase-like enzyme
VAVWDDLTVAELTGLAEALRTGRLPPQPTGLALARMLGGERAALVASELAAWGAPAAATAAWLELLAVERQRIEAAHHAIDLVWTGPEVPGAANRDTGAVMRELFVAARRSVFLAGYAIHRGDEVFRLLAERMDREPGLDVRLVVDIQRNWNDSTLAQDLVYQFAADFRQNQWPGTRLPAVFYDPRSLALDPSRRASMHAKCVVIDGEMALVTSANFTTAAQTKNIEVGALLRQRALATRLEQNFASLIRTANLVALPTQSN